MTQQQIIYLDEEPGHCINLGPLSGAPVQRITFDGQLRETRQRHGPLARLKRDKASAVALALAHRVRVWATWQHLEDDAHCWRHL